MKFPDSLNHAYAQQLDSMGLMEEAMKVAEEKNIYGGQTEHQTNQHFAHRFAVSCGRVEYCTIGPNDQFTELSNALLTTFSEGEVSILDAPSGTGAATAALLSSIVQLRLEKVMPRLPLHIAITAGDYSGPSRIVFESLLSRLQEEGHKQGVTWEVQVVDWDATRADQTSALVDKWFDQGSQSKEWIVLISNFSGELRNKSEFDKFGPSLEHIAARIHDRKSTILWVEPKGSSKKKGPLEYLKEWVECRLPWLFRSTGSDPSSISSTYKLHHPLKNIEMRTNVAVERFERR